MILPAYCGLKKAVRLRIVDEVVVFTLSLTILSTSILGDGT